MYHREQTNVLFPYSQASSHLNPVHHLLFGLPLSKTKQKKKKTRKKQLLNLTRLISLVSVHRDRKPSYCTECVCKNVYLYVNV